jgi:hypothetical protein
MAALRAAILFLGFAFVQTQSTVAIDLTLRYSDTDKFALKLSQYCRDI